VRVVPFVACAAILWLLTSITWEEWTMTLALLVAASLLYLVTAPARGRPPGADPA
jgi:hypothetical protein